MEKTISFIYLGVRVLFTCLVLSGVVFACGSDDGGDDDDDDDDSSDTGGETNPVCEVGAGDGEVQAPEHLMSISGHTGWFASPVIYDLDGDGSNELIAAHYSIDVFDHTGAPLSSAEEPEGRIYAPHVIADLDGDGTIEIVAGSGAEVFAYEWRGGALSLKSGWPADTTCGDQSPEVRGLAAADLDGDGSIEVVATTTQTLDTSAGGAQVFAFSADGSLYQPAGGHNPAWPRYNALSGPGNDADRNGQGHDGFGCYGLNVGIGNIDDDEQLEVIATYDNHHIQAFDHDGVAIDTSPWFANRNPDFQGNPMTWGQFIRWVDPEVEENHYHLHEGEWPHPEWAEWLQWTDSPPNVVDLDGDGKNEVVGVPFVEMNVPYETQAYAIMVLEGAYGDGDRSAHRKPGWEVLPRGDAPIEVEGWYPPRGIPAPAIVDVQGDESLEIIVSLNDGYLYLFDAAGQRIWQFNYTHGKPIMYASEPTVADLNQDGSPEIAFTTFGDPDETDSGYLVILAANGTLLHDIALPDPGHNGNGSGAPAAPTIGDLDGDGQLEIVTQAFYSKLDVFTVPGSGTNCLLWSTARGGPLRNGHAHVLK